MVIMPLTESPKVRPAMGNDISFGTRLKRYRRELDLTQAELAERSVAPSAPEVSRPTQSPLPIAV